MTQPKTRDGRHDFDFLIGSWKGKQRRLKERLKGSTEWEEFESTSTFRHILDGIGNVDEVTMERDGGKMLGFTLRLYDPSTGQWYIYWATGAGGHLDLPMVGGFDENGRGIFYAHEPFQGRYVYVRFLWSYNPADDTARWEQAFSDDGGATWETNWTMDFTRLA